MNKTLATIHQAVLEGNAPGVKDNVQAAVNSGMDAGLILNDCLIPAMNEVGRLFEEGEYYIPEMLISAKAMKAGLAILQPLLMKSNIQAKGRVVIGTVQGDLHDIGKNLVAIMLEGAGFEVIDLGADVSPDKFVEAIQTRQPDIVAMSALLTTTMPRMKDTIEFLIQKDVRKQVKVMIGGAPVTADYAQKIGADGYSEDASRAVTLAKSLMG